MIYVLIHLVAEVGATASFLQHALHTMKLACRGVLYASRDCIGNRFVSFRLVNFQAEG